MSARAVAFLDRDGTLIDTDVYEGRPTPKHGTVEFAVGASWTCEHLRKLGYALVMVTNQPDVARGLIDRRTVEIDNQHVKEYLGLDLAVTCMHDDGHDCECRKPRPGLLLEAAATLGIDLDRSSVMIGDRWRDVEAGIAAGVTTVLLDRGYGENHRTLPDHTASNLFTAVEWIDGNLRKGRRHETSHRSQHQDLRGRS